MLVERCFFFFPSRREDTDTKIEKNLYQRQGLAQGSLSKGQID